MVQEAIKRVWKTSQNMMNLGYDMRSWNAETFDAERTGTVVNEAGSAQQHLAWVVEIHLKNTSEAFDCISRNWPKTDRGAKHVIPVCEEQMARANFKGRFCPSLWVEIWSAEFVGKYRQVWHCTETNSQYGTLMAGKSTACGSAWLPKRYSEVK